MATNQAEKLLGRQRLVNELAKLRKDIQDMKSTQFVGNDSLVTKTTGEIVFTINVGSNVLTHFYLSYLGYALAPYLAEPGVSVFVNTNNDVAFRHPRGSSITPELRAIMWGFRNDFKEPSTNPALGIKTYYFWVWNYGATAKTLYFHVRLFYPGFEQVESEGG